MQTELSIKVMEQYLGMARAIEEKAHTLTIRDCMNKWGYHSTSAARHMMNRMVLYDMLKKFKRGRSTYIYRTNPAYVMVYKTEK